MFEGFETKSFGEKADYTGTDRNSWIPCTLQLHREYAEKHKDSKFRAKQKEIEREHGLRYSVLLELPYFDVVRYSVIDPMHNLLLGTAKHYSFNLEGLLDTWRQYSPK